MDLYKVDAHTQLWNGEAPTNPGKESPTWVGSATSGPIGAHLLSGVSVPLSVRHRPDHYLFYSQISRSTRGESGVVVRHRCPARQVPHAST